MIFTGNDIRLAASKAGHDKGEVFVIVRDEGEYVFLADGRSRTVAAPKRKNRKHIQIIKKIPEEALEVLTAGNLPDDLAVKRALKLYGLSIKGEE